MVPAKRADVRVSKLCRSGQGAFLCFEGVATISNRRLSIRIDARGAEWRPRTGLPCERGTAIERRSKLQPGPGCSGPAFRRARGVVAIAGFVLPCGPQHANRPLDSITLREKKLLSRSIETVQVPGPARLQLRQRQAVSGRRGCGRRDCVRARGRYR